MDRNQWKTLYDVFDHKRRVELAEQQHLFVERPNSVAKEVRDDLELEDEGKWVFCGSIGSGKSSELVHLASLLGEQYMVVGVDLSNSIENIQKIEPAEVLVLIGASVLETVKEGWAAQPNQQLAVDLQGAFRGLMATPDEGIDWPKLLASIGLFAFSMTVGNVVGAIGAAAALPETVVSRAPKEGGRQLGGVTRPGIREGEADMVALVDAVNAILLAAQALTARKPVLLVDGLDKVENIAQIRLLFTGSRALASPRCHLVYSAPIVLMQDTEWQAAGDVFERERLHNIVVAKPALPEHGVKDELVAAGVAAMKNVVARRVQGLGLELVDVFENGQLERVIEHSGGVLRTLIYLVNRSIRKARSADAVTIGGEHVDAAIRELSGEFEPTLTTQMEALLIEIRTSGKLPDNGDLAIRLAVRNYVLPYRNGRHWWGVPPLLGRLLPT